MSSYENLPHESDKSRIVRRLGLPPRHRNCDCPCSYTPIIFLASSGGFVVSIPENGLVTDSQLPKISEEVKALGGGGGIAPYERMDILDRRNFIKSAHDIAAQLGVIVSSGWQQDPLFDYIPVPDNRERY